LNQYSALVGDFERIFFAPTLKIVLQHIRGQSGLEIDGLVRSLVTRTGHARLPAGGYNISANAAAPPQRAMLCDPPRAVPRATGVDLQAARRVVASKSM